MYGSSLIIVTRRPRHLSNRPSEEAVRPFPSEEETPPVTKTYLVTPGASPASPYRSPRQDPNGGVETPSRRVTVVLRPAVPRRGVGPSPIPVDPTTCAPA